MRRPVVLATTLALAGTAAIAATTATAGGAAAAGATAAARPDPAAAIRLVTGDQVIHPGANNVLLRQAAASGPARSFRLLSVGTHRYALPVTALPYLNRGLDPALFDLNALSPDSALKVHLTYRSGTSSHDVPGVTLTSQTSGGADGYLTPESAKRFGAALASQWTADQRARDFGAHGIFAGVSAIRPAATAAPPVQPHYPMYTLSLNVLDQTGQPMPAGGVGLLNVDDWHKFGTISGVYKGVAKFSVPAGHYAVTTEANVYNEAAGHLQTWLATLPEVTVTGNQSLTIDARTATSPVAVPAPAGTGLDTMIAGFERTGAGGGGMDWWEGGGNPDDQVWVSPTAPVTVGHLAYCSQWWFSSPTATYSAVYPTVDYIPATQTHQIDPADMAAIDTGYASDQPSSQISEYQIPIVASPGFTPEQKVSAPSRRTEYVTAGPGIAWQKELILGDDDDIGVLDGNVMAYQPGQHVTENWDLPLRHPQAEVDTGAEPYFVPAATRRGDAMLFNLAPYGDSTPGHLGHVYFSGTGPDSERASWSLYAGDTQIASAEGSLSTPITAPADPANYRLVLDTDVSASWWKLSAKTHTEWRFASTHQSGGSLPDPRWHCDRDQGPTDCVVLPLLMPQYALHGIGLDGHAPAGPSTLDLTVAPVQGAAPSPMASVTVEVSYDDGTSWTPATVAGSGSQYTASYTTPNPASTDGYVSVRTTATDAAGDAVTQTLIHAYALGS